MLESFDTFLDEKEQGKAGRREEGLAGELMEFTAGLAFVVI